MGILASKKKTNPEPTVEDWPDGKCKIVMVGDGAVGKTCLGIRCLTGEFPVLYIPTVCDNYQVDDRDYGPFSVWDTASNEDYPRLRGLSYIQANCFLLCFSVVSPTSLDNIIAKWVPEVQHHRPEGRLLLVGTKSDLREDQDTLEYLRKQGNTPISNKDAQAFADTHNLRFLECSSLTGEGVEQIFRAATDASPIIRLGPKRALS